MSSLKGIVLFSPGPFGGAEKCIISSMGSLPEMELWIIAELRNPQPAKDFIQKCKDNNIKYKVYESTKRIDKVLINKLKLDLAHFDFIHSHGLKANFIASKTGKKFIATQHGKTSHNFKMKIMEFIEARALKKAQALICVSQEMYNSLHHHNKVYIPNFVSLSAKMNHELQYQNKLSLLYVGRLSPEKNPIFLINQISEIEGVELHIIGDGHLKQEVIQACQKHKNIYYHGFQEDILKFYLENHVLVIPSLREGLPMIALEALSIGMPIISTRVGAMPDLLQDDYIYSVNDRLSFLKIIKNFQTNYDDQKIYFLKNKDQINQQYSLKSWIKRTRELYSRI